MSGNRKNKGYDNGVEKGSESVEIKNIGRGNSIINSGFFKGFMFLAGIVLFATCFSGTAFAQADVGVSALLFENYTNSQCLLCYDIVRDTVTDLKHEMYETITVNKSGVVSLKNNLSPGDIEEALKMNYTIKYSVYVDYLPPVFLKDKNGGLIDSRYRGKMIFLGEEYFVKEWDDKEKTLKLAKGEEIIIDNREFSGNFTAKKGTYLVKINRALFSEDRVAGIVVVVKKPDGTEIQAVAQRSLNAVIGDVEVYVSNVATAGNFTQADVTVYDLTSEIVLEHNEFFGENKEWYVEMKYADLDCLSDIGPGSKGKCGYISGSKWNPTEPSNSVEKFKVYGKISGDYGNSGMLKGIYLTLNPKSDILICYNDSDCKTKNCVRGICRPEGYCKIGTDCSSDQYCVDNKCETLKSTGSQCSESSECKTGNCFNETCKEEGFRDENQGALPENRDSGDNNKIPAAKGAYVNSQCFLMYDICRDTVIDLKHTMYETITVNNDVKRYENGVSRETLENAAKQSSEGDTIRYSIYADYLPPVFLMNKDESLIDSRYRGKVIFLGEEYFVKDWNDDEKTIKLAKGQEMTIDNKEFADFTANKNTYRFKVHRALYSEDKVAGMVVDVKKPDETEIQAVSQRSLTAVIGDVEVYTTNLATAGEFVQADIIVYDLSTEITLKEGDAEVFGGDKEWEVKISDVDLGCLAYLTGDGSSSCAAGSAGEWETKSNNAGVTSDDRENFKDYGAVDASYAGEGMLKRVDLTLKTGRSGELYPAGSGEPGAKYNSESELNVNSESGKGNSIDGVTGILILGLIVFMVLVVWVYLRLVKKKT